MGKRKAQSTGAAKKSQRIEVNTDAKKAADAKAQQWERVDDMLIYRKGPHSSKIAAFDIDGTIITTKSGRTFATGPKDWKYLFPNVPDALKKLHDDGFRVVFLTNQLGISKGKVDEGDFRSKMEAIMEGIDCPVHIQASLETGWNRKPAPGSWHHLVEHENGGVKVNVADSFFCGDAAGRPEDKARKIKKDFSLADRLFALNLGLKFKTPEEFFLKEAARPFNMPEFHAKKQCDEAKPIDYKKFVGSKQEMIVNVGFPASGKSYFSKKYLVPAGYEYVSRDVLGTWQKCAKRASEVLGEGKSVVIDNTSPDLESRGLYIGIAKEAKVPVRCFHFAVSKTHARHNEVFRQLVDPSHSKIPDMVMNMFNSKFKQPTVSEGFQEVVTIPFAPNFKTKKDQELYSMYLLEK